MRKKRCIQVILIILTTTQLLAACSTKKKRDPQDQVRRTERIETDSMRILITNDDGIEAAGIHKLIEVAKQITPEVYVVAPAGQRSAISHSFTIVTPLTVRQVDHTGAKKAYSCSGTPADCVKVAVRELLDEKPDLILSGINHGYNMGYDTVYSGTVAAAREGTYCGITSMAVSAYGDEYGQVDEHLKQIIEDLLSREKKQGEIWNINFPKGGAAEFLGVKETVPSDRSFYLDTYFREQTGVGEWKCRLKDERCYDFEDGSDFAAVEAGYISIEKLCCAVIASKS